MKPKDQFLVLDAGTWRLSVYGTPCLFGSLPLKSLPAAEVFADGLSHRTFAILASAPERLLGIGVTRGLSQCRAHHSGQVIWDSASLGRLAWPFATLPVMVEEESYDLLLEWSSGKGDGYGTLTTDAGLFENSRGRSSASFRYDRSSHVGHVYVNVWLGGIAVASVVFLVLSSKLDYFTERRVMLSELNQTNRTLATRLFRPTVGSAQQIVAPAEEIEFASNLSARLSDATVLLRRLQNKGLSSLSREPQRTPEHRVRRLRETAEARLERDVGATHEPSKMVADVRVVTRDTSENRHALRLCQDLVNRGLAAERRMSKEKSIATKPAYAEFQRGLRKLRSVTRNEYWSGIGRPSDSEVLPSSALFHTEIARLGKLYRESRRALDTERFGAARISLMGMDAQYETWVLLKLLGCVAEALGAPAQSPPISQRNLFSRIDVGIESEIKFDHGVSVFFKPSILPRKLPTRAIEDLLRTPLYEQEPDSLVVSFAGRKCIVLDAKYSVDNKSLAASKYSAGMLRPAPDSVNAMHRYRDAIRDRATGESAIVFAGAIYPGDTISADIEIDMSVLEGIGAIPLRPGNHQQLEDLTKLLAKVVVAQLAAFGGQNTLF